MGLYESVSTKQTQAEAQRSNSSSRVAGHGPTAAAAYIHVELEGVAVALSLLKQMLLIRETLWRQQQLFLAKQGGAAEWINYIPF